MCIRDRYWSILQAGAEQAGKDLGCKVVVVGTALESDIEGQLTLLDVYKRQGEDNADAHDNRTSGAGYGHGGV